MRSRRTRRRSRYPSRLASFAGSPCEGGDLNHGKTVGLTAFARCDFPDSIPSSILPRRGRAARRRCEGRDLNPWTTGRRFLLASLAGLRLPRSRSLPLVAHETSTGADFESDVDASLSALITYGIYAREERPREAVFRTAEQCEGRDLNPWTSTGADLESAAVSRLGYPRTRSRNPRPSVTSQSLTTPVAAPDGRHRRFSQIGRAHV